MPHHHHPANDLGEVGEGVGASRPGGGGVNNPASAPVYANGSSRLHKETIASKQRATLKEPSESRGQAAQHKVSNSTAHSTFLQLDHDKYADTPSASHTSGIKFDGRNGGHGQGTLPTKSQKSLEKPLRGSSAPSKSSLELTWPETTARSPKGRTPVDAGAGSRGLDAPQSAASGLYGFGGRKWTSRGIASSKNSRAQSNSAPMNSRAQSNSAAMNSRAQFNSASKGKAAFDEDMAPRLDVFSDREDLEQRRSSRSFGTGDFGGEWTSTSRVSISAGGSRLSLTFSEDELGRGGESARDRANSTTNLVPHRPYDPDGVQMVYDLGRPSVKGADGRCRPPSSGSMLAPLLPSDSEVMRNSTSGYRKITLPRDRPVCQSSVKLGFHHELQSLLFEFKHSAQLLDEEHPEALGEDGKPLSARKHVKTAAHVTFTESLRSGEEGLLSLRGNDSVTRNWMRSPSPERSRPASTDMSVSSIASGRQDTSPQRQRLVTYAADLLDGRPHTADGDLERQTSRGGSPVGYRGPRAHFEVFGFDEAEKARETHGLQHKRPTPGAKPSGFACRHATRNVELPVVLNPRPVSTRTK